MALVCMLCHRAEVDAGLCGHKLKQRGLCAHKFCLYFATQLSQQPVEKGQVRYSCRDIIRTIEHAAQKTCCVCRKTGATIACRESGCERSFHLPCAVKGGCVTQYFSPRRSFCRKHSPRQKVEAVPEKATRCLICLDQVGNTKSYGTLVCPACKHAWFHRGCIQGQALQDGITQLQCPLCRGKDGFQREMLRMGIRIPFRLPSRDPEAHAELSARHGRCDASVCLCPGGRERAEPEGPWELLLCSSCAAEGTHRRCSHLENITQTWECQGCAGPTTASSSAPEPAGPSGPSRAAPEGSGGSSPRGARAAPSPLPPAAPGPAPLRAAGPPPRDLRMPPPSAGPAPPPPARSGPSAGSGLWLGRINTTCLTCLDLLEGRKSSSPVRCPCADTPGSTGAASRGRLWATAFLLQGPALWGQGGISSEMLSMASRLTIRLPARGPEAHAELSVRRPAGLCTGSLPCQGLEAEALKIKSLAGQSCAAIPLSSQPPTRLVSSPLGAPAVQLLRCRGHPPALLPPGNITER